MTGIAKLTRNRNEKCANNIILKLTIWGTHVQCNVILKYQNKNKEKKKYLLKILTPDCLVFLLGYLSELLIKFLCILRKLQKN